MTAKPESLPGMTAYQRKTHTNIQDIQKENVQGIQKENVQSHLCVNDRKVIMIGSSTINMKTIFNNGLIQNVYILYRMFQSMGYIPILLVQAIPEDLPPYMSDLSILTIDSYLKTAIKVHTYIEVAMSIDTIVKQFLKQNGCKIYKLYLGNILNIDIESPLTYPGMYFVHHYIGDVDNVWVSPHYMQHSEYSKCVNGVPIKIPSPPAPYVWDSAILTHGGTRSFQWNPPAKGSETFLLIEPNISFQKTSIVPLCILESWYRNLVDKGAWTGKVVIVNGNRLEVLPFFTNSLAQSYDLIKDGRVEFRGRMTIIEILTEFPSAIPICHQWNNEYNYMVLEYFHCLYPVLHNASDWSSYGYYYPNSDIATGVRTLEKIIASHKDTLENFKMHAKSLTWRHSPYNPDIQREWNSLIN